MFGARSNLLFATVLFALVASVQSAESKTLLTAQQYRDLTHKIRTSGEFLNPMPGVQATIKYKFEFAQPVYPTPIISDSRRGSDGRYFYRSFWDRIMFKDGSYVEINGEQLPLTCVFIDGQDNRFGNKELSPLFPQFVIRVYLVVNDYSCQGPKRKGWPAIGGKAENWDTYLYYEIKDPTIMLPVEAKIRYRWNEFNLVFVDRGEP